MYLGVKIKVYDERINGWFYVEIPFRKWLELVIFEATYLRHDTKQGWSGMLPFYIVKCSRHGYFLDYPQGWYEKFRCPLCRREPPLSLIPY
ncbi:MAG: hypothetical protein QXK78_02795 [Candidatus Bathyarchaeia archaeon]